MSNFLKYTYSLFLLGLFFSCSSNECTKEVIIQQEYVFIGEYGDTLVPEKTQEISCDIPNPRYYDPVSDDNSIKEFSYEVINFIFTPNTENNTIRIQFEIKLNNENDFLVKGFPLLHIDSDSGNFSLTSEYSYYGGYLVDAIEPCHTIEANSSCILTYDKEIPFDFHLKTLSKFELVSVKYQLAFP